MKVRTNLVAVSVLLLIIPGPAPSQNQNSGTNNSVGVISPDDRVDGLNYAQWSVKWWQWAVSIPIGTNPIYNYNENNCGLGQGPVWFLAGTSGGSATRTCTLPLGTLIFFPIINYDNDYPCPNPAFHPKPGQSLQDFLTKGAQDAIPPGIGLTVEVDHKSLQHLSDYRATSGMFTFKGDISWKSVDSCITGWYQPVVSDGYWIMLEPLSAGTHLVHFRAATPSFLEGVDYTLTIVPQD